MLKGTVIRPRFEAEPAPLVDRDPNDPAWLFYTSGTTGRSKGVVLSHRKLEERIVAANTALGIGPGDRVLWMLPMAHHFAVSIVLYLYHGACTVIGAASPGSRTSAVVPNSRGSS